MRSKEEIDADIAHIGYARAVFDERLTVLKAERDQLREDEYATARVTKRLSAFFKAHGLYIVGLHSGERSKDHYALAKQMWRSRAVLLPFVKKLSQHKEPSFVYEIASLSVTDRTDLKNLCDMLAKHGWMSFNIRPDSFEITPSLRGVQKQFLSGAWAEEINLYLIDKTLKTFTLSYHQGYKLFWDLKLKRIDSDKENGHDMQLDLVVEVGDRFYVFETKSGFTMSIGKWVDRTRLFGDDKNRFITCTANEKLSPLIFSPFCLFALPTLEAQFLEMLQADFPSPASDRATGNPGNQGQTRI